MPPRSAGTRRTTRGASAPSDVETYLASLDHPARPEILALREIILGAHPSISEGIKWKVPSFRTTEYFATLNVRAKEGMQVILHYGAKVRESATMGVEVADPDSLLEWLAKDRASVKFRDLRDVEARRAAFANVIREWIRHV
ncbi:MAG TPA: DUF1801 domain-containing protein [Gemmatimonadaceae bacterium]|nr:DUF1801 domain-containing protein [Gemmatimonadaceae bacterium]